MTDFLADSFLFFGHQEFIIPLLILGYIWFDQRTFYHALCLIGVSIVLNAALKSTFKVPLATFLKQEGFAFPSGHMQASTTLYGWIILRYSHKCIRSSLTILLIGIGISLVHFGYHNYADVFAGAFIAILLIKTYSWLLQHKPRLLPWFTIIFVTSLMFYIHHVYHLQPYVWRAYYTLWGTIVLAQTVFSKFSFMSFSQKIWGTIIMLGSFGLIKILLFTPSFPELPVYLSQLKWLIVGSIFPISNALAHYSDTVYKNAIGKKKVNGASF